MDSTSSRQKSTCTRLVLIFLATVLVGPQILACEAAVVERASASLYDAARTLHRMPETSARAFLAALPDTFDCYEAVFGYPDGPLYGTPDMFHVFSKLATAAPRDRYVRKVIRLAVGGRWDADQINALQDAVRTVLEAQPQSFARQVGALTAEDERSVWRFLFGGPHPRNEVPSDGVRRAVCAVSARTCRLLDEALKDALAGEERH